jgi:hypothetical protein
MKQLLILMTVGILASCSKQDQIQDLEQPSVIMGKPVIDTVTVTNVYVNTDNGYYSYGISFDKPLKHKADIVLSWTTLYKDQALSHHYNFTTTKAQSQYVVTNVKVEWKPGEFGQITHVFHGPLDMISANHTYFIY